ncbi:hypothetical protein GBA52_009664 [Prunus armeniaca]|nr:hypothetical protein GBA52_009664 [Prunus armeniaca]
MNIAGMKAGMGKKGLTGIEMRMAYLPPIRPIAIPTKGPYHLVYGDDQFAEKLVWKFGLHSAYRGVWGRLVKHDLHGEELGGIYRPLLQKLPPSQVTVRPQLCSYLYVKKVQTED